MSGIAPHAKGTLFEYLAQGHQLKVPLPLVSQHRQCCECVRVCSTTPPPLGPLSELARRGKSFVSASWDVLPIFQFQHQPPGLGGGRMEVLGLFDRRLRISPLVLQKEDLAVCGGSRDYHAVGWVLGGSGVSSRKSQKHQPAKVKRTDMQG